MEFVGGLLVLVGAVVGIESFRAVTRKALVRRWAAEHGYTLLEFHYRFLGTWANWLTAYDVRWSHRGAEHEGRVLATGFIRSHAWLDETGSGRGQVA